MNSIARGKFGSIVRMARGAGGRGNCFTMPDSGKSRMSQVESMRGAKMLTPRRRGIEAGRDGSPLPSLICDGRDGTRVPTMAKPGTETSPGIDVEEKLKEAF